MNKQTLLYLLIFLFARPELVEGSPSLHSLAHTYPIAHIPINPFSTGFMCISSPDGITVVDAKEKKMVMQSIIVNSKGYLVTLNGKSCNHGTWHLLPKNNELTINGKHYAGPATLKINAQFVQLTTQSTPPDILQLTWGYNQKKETSAHTPIIKVLIAELANNQSKPLIISCDNSSITIKYHKHKLWINDKPCPKNQLHIVPKEGYASINGTNFQGSFEVMVYNDKALLINHVDLEEYVYGVLKSESMPGWPIEVNKAFAIASRSYVMAMMRQSSSKLPYHVKNTSAHQNYNGMHASMTLRTAVEQTRGIFLSHNNEPALAMFDICCGGIIPAHIDDFDFQKAPYLARTYPCAHCKRCKIYAWKKEFTLPEFGKKIAHLIDGSAQNLALRDVKIGKKDKAGLVHELLINPGDNQKKIPGKQFYAALKDIKSFCYNVHRKKDRLIFSGNGYGHHLGICQWGAREMVKDGWPYTRILNFYYPGTKLVKLT